MTVHMIWGLVGFNLALLFMWVYHILRTRGVGFFWYHPVLAGSLLVLILYVLESFFADLSQSEIQLNWSLMLWAGLPLCGLAMLFFFRAIHLHQNKEK